MAKLRGIVALVLAVLLCIAFVGCGTQPETSSVPASSAPAPSASVASVPEEPEEPALPDLPPLPLAEGVNALSGLEVREDMPSGQIPVAIVIANNQRALPQRGIAAADVLFESVTEAGITRIMAMYADYTTMPQVGPVRSTRDQFVQLAMPMHAAQAHIGTSVYARNLLDVSGIKDINGLFLGDTAFWFDEARTLPRMDAKPNEYCWYTDAQLLQTGIDYLELDTTAEVRQMFNFTDDAFVSEGDAYFIDVSYTLQSFSGFIYDEETQLYGKTIFNANHADEDGTPLLFTNIILLNCGMGLKTDGMCTEVDFSRGDGLYFTQGGVQEITWYKGEPEDALRLLDANGEELAVQRGKSYVGFVPADGGTVTYAGA